MLNCVQTANLLKSWDRVLVLSHASPDGDTLGSAAALLWGLASLGKKVAFRCADEIAPKFQYLFEGLALEEPDAAFHVMSVDVADPSLLGGLKDEYQGRVELAIDHHGTHIPFAKERWVEPESAATAELIWLLLQELGVQIDSQMAGCVYTGLSTDTGCFRYRNCTPRTHRIAAQAMEAGADAGGVNQRMFETKPWAQIQAERLVMEGLETFCAGKCAMSMVPRSVYAETGAKESDLEGVASLPRQIEGVLIGVTLKEREDGTVKASVRSVPPANSAELCALFGGGGHAGAAGCTFEGHTLEQAAEKMKAACENYLKEIGKL